MEKDMSKRKIILDFDSVLAQTILSCVTMYDTLYHNHPDFVRIEPNEIKTWDMRELTLMKKSELIDYFDSEEFFTHLIPMESAIEFVDKYRDRIWVCTSGSTKNIRNKLKYIENTFGEVNIVPVIKPRNSEMTDKSIVDFNGSVFVDDNQKNLWSATGDVFKVLFNEFGCELNREWNSKWDGSVVSSFEELDKLIELIDN